MIQKFSVSVIGSNLPYIFNTQQEAINFTKKSIFARSSKVDIATKEDLARLKRVYIASPLFTDKEKYRINSVVKELRLLGNTVYSPMEFTVDDAWSLSNEEWSRKVYDHDIDDLEKADTVVCIYDGLMSDTGTAWEVGYAFAKGKKVIIICDSPTVKQSLMMINGCTMVCLKDTFLEAWYDYVTGNYDNTNESRFKHTNRLIADQS